MDSRPPQPSQLARILCECLESSLISEDAPKAVNGVFPGVLSLR